MKKRFFWLWAAALLYPFSSTAETHLTIYSTATPGTQASHYTSSQSVPGYALVHEKRSLTLRDNTNIIPLTDIPSSIIPSTVRVSSLTDPQNTRLLEQEFHFDSTNIHTLLTYYIGQEISVDTLIGDDIKTIKGILVSASGDLILEQNDGLVAVKSYSHIRFPKLRDTIATIPTLEWHITTNSPGTHTIDFSYQAGGLSWLTHYHLTFTEGRKANHGTLDLDAWITLINHSGKDFLDTHISLAAGDIQHFQAPVYRGMAMMEATKAAPSRFQEKAFSEFHLYSLDGTISLPHQSSKQIEFIPTLRNIPAQKQLIYYPTKPYRYHHHPYTNRGFGLSNEKKLHVSLRFKNSKKNGLGIPLPKGTLRVHTRDNNQTPIFIGEDRIDHTAKDETVSITLGESFDVVGERKQQSFENNGKQITEQFTITLRNHKDTSADVLVKENLYRAKQWRITDTNTNYNKLDAFTIEFPVTIKAGSSKTISYRVSYSL